MNKKLVYFFANGVAEGNAEMKDILGGKGANLAEMTNLGIPVPPGFTISAEVCRYYYQHGRTYPEGLKEEVEQATKRLEQVTKKGFGDPERPLLVSVRSGAAISMPGMMDTILNLGLNDETVKGLIKMTNNPRFAYDAYRRFLQMFGDTALGIAKNKFENALEEMKKQKGVKLDIELDADDLKKLVEIYKKIYEEEGKKFPQDVYEQLWLAINAVFGSWMSDRAVKYREIHNIREDEMLGTAVNVVAMVFGNMGERSGTGVAFTRNPNTGEKEVYGEFLQNAQGEDVVAGIRTPLPLAELKRLMPEVYDELMAIMDKLERHYKDMQDIEFTIEEGKLYMLQTRSGKRTSRAAIKIAVDMAKEGIINKEEAVLRVKPEDIERVLHPRFDEKARAKAKVIAKGLPASPGAATGVVIFDAKKALAREVWILVQLVRWIRPRFRKHFLCGIVLGFPLQRTTHFVRFNLDQQERFKLSFIVGKLRRIAHRPHGRILKTFGHLGWNCASTFQTRVGKISTVRDHYVRFLGAHPDLFAKKISNGFGQLLRFLPWTHRQEEVLILLNQQNLT